MKTYKEVYQLPLEDQHGWIYDQKGNFVFQFLIDNEEKKARFDKDRRNKKGEILQEYSSIFARAMMVAAKIIEGEIKISDEINKIED